MGRLFRGIDIIMLGAIIGISCFGLFILLSISQEFFWEQLGFFAIAVGLLFVVSKIDSVAIRYFSPYLYVLSLVVLLSTHLFPEIRGASRWIFIGPIQIQSSEIVKPFIMLYFAVSMSRFSPRKMKYFPLHFFFLILPFLIIFEQPDLGTGIVYSIFWFAMMFAGGLPFFMLIMGAFLGLVALPIGWRALERFQQLRILAFLNPSFDPSGAGYNAFQAMIAVGSGQFFGRGLGMGTQSHLRFLPEFHTDFIFATLVEELGFIGGLCLLVLFAVLLWRIVRPLIAQEEKGDISYFYSIGVFFMILIQLFVNTGMNMGIIPITGITLPFVSSGGSSMISLGITFGILLALRKGNT